MVAPIAYARESTSYISSSREEDKGILVATIVKENGILQERKCYKEKQELWEKFNQQQIKAHMKEEKKWTYVSKVTSPSK